MSKLIKFKRHAIENALKMNDSILLYQIFYDQTSRSHLEPGYLPLDNASNERPDWYEAWPIRKYLLNSKLDQNAWYGFFSPNFGQKTGISYEQVLNFVTHFKVDADVTLFHYRWDEVAYFKNVFIHGDLAHPGLSEMTNKFLMENNLEINLSELVNHSGNSVFSNNIVAKPKFWLEWLELVGKFIDYVDAAGTDNALELRNQTTYGLAMAPMKAFIQERLSSIILQNQNWKIAAMDNSLVAPISDLFQNEPKSRRLLQVCDILKQEYLKTGRQEYLRIFERLRKKIAKGHRLDYLEQIQVQGRNE